MSSNKSPLHEVASNAEALKTARGEPIQRQEQPRQTMDFFRSLILDVPVQAVKETQVRENMNIEGLIQAKLESEVKKLEAPKDATDSVSFDIPTLIRVFELVREGIKNDVELHNLVERLVAMRTKGVLTMDDYAEIAGGNPQGTSREGDSGILASLAGNSQNESVLALKKLAGIR
jgi:hypothetical protein